MSGAGLILAAPASGSGKTLVTAGLLRYLQQRGIRVAAAKCGPDYIDPTFHARASGAPCVNLDAWAMRPTTLAGLVGELESSADIVLCEGVMGLFDGAGPDGEAGSTAELAGLTGWPVVLVVDASGQGASVAALVAGFARHDPDVPLAAIILNRVASPRHRELLTTALAKHLPALPVVGALPREPGLAMPSRHLGLVPAGEHQAIDALIDTAAARVGSELAIDQLMRLARPSHAASRVAAGLRPLGQHIAIARDDAFLFTYAATLAGWRRQGAELSFFSPLADEAPPGNADAVYLPGGYPELHAGRLAAASHFLVAMRSAAANSTTIYGECGGYMVLGETLTDASGETHLMADLLPVKTSFATPRRHLGYRSARLIGDGPLGAAGDRFRGHEFHYSSIVEEKCSEALFDIADAAGTPLGYAGLQRGPIIGSFIHLIDQDEVHPDESRGPPIRFSNG